MGTNTVDHVALVDRFANGEEKVLVRQGEMHPGGAVVNNLSQAARLGAKVGWVGLLGDDAEMRYLRGAMRECEVEEASVRVLKGKRTPWSWLAVTPDGERGIYMFANVNLDVTPTHVERYFAPSIRRALHFHTEVAQQRLSAVLAGMRVAREAKVKVILDLDVPPTDAIHVSKLGSEEELSRVVAAADVIKPCKAAALELTGRRDLEGAALELLDRGPEIVAITAGREGALLATRHEMVKVPSIPMSVKDTTGAGDAFMGGLTFALLCGEPLRRVGAIANACAALCVARIGSRSQGSYEELRSILRTMPAY